MAFVLPKLPYGDSDLDPVISAETIGFHYGKHHNTYVVNLNNLTKDSPLADASLDDVIAQTYGKADKVGLYNNAAQIWNHTFYWFCLSPKGGGQPSGALADAITKKFGSFDEFKKQFTQTAVTTFGSGWAWLVKNADGSIELASTSNAQTPLTQAGKTPLLTCDVWEHAYYIDFRNRRPDYVGAFWNLVDWEFVAKNFAA